MGLNAGDAVQVNAFLFATFTRATFGWIVAEMGSTPVLDFTTYIGQHVHDALYAGAIDYVAVINAPETVSGDDKVVFALQTFPGADAHTYAELADALNHLEASAVCYALRPTDQTSAFSATSRTAEKLLQEQQAKDDSPLDQLQQFFASLGWVVIGVVVLLLLFLGYTAYRELR